MANVVVQYRCRPEAADENQRLVEAVSTQLAADDPGGLRYATWRLDDETFVHIAHVEGDNPLVGLSAFAEFQSELPVRCVDGPNPRPATLVGSYRFDVS